jgi:hypothetical protein
MMLIYTSYQVSARKKLYVHTETDRKLHTPEFTATMPVATFPPFPENIPTHPLLIIDYELIKAQDQGEINRLWDAGTNLGFW